MNSKIVVSKSMHIRQPNMEEDANVLAISYASNEKNSFLEAVSLKQQRWYHFYINNEPYSEVEQFIRRSEDNGVTWERVEDWKMEIPLNSGRNMVYDMPEFFLDPDNGRLFRVVNEAEEDPAVTVWEEASPIARTRRIYIQVSQDEGRTWSHSEQLVVQGEEFDSVHYGDDIWYGKNSVLIEGARAVKLPNGTILLPFTRYILPEDAVNYIPGEKSYRQVFQPGFFIGQWRKDGTGLDWRQGGYISISHELSPSGLDEPSADILPDGRLYAIMRAGVDKEHKTKYPSTKYYSVSSDNGLTWTDPEPLRYTNDDIVYSSGSIANVLKSSKNGRFYLIANILDEPTYGDDPRNVLQIAEIDGKSLRVKRDTVTVIEKCKPEDGEPSDIRYSNFRWYEDRETKNIVLFVSASVVTGRTAECGCPPHSHRYDIQLPE